MAGNRRQFITGTASATVFGISEASAQKRSRRRRRAGLHSPPVIGVVHTTALEAQFKACFLAGLASKNWSPTPTGNQNKVTFAPPAAGNGQYGGSHGHTDLRTAINNLLANPVDVIVTAGGLVGQAAAWTELTGVDVPCVFLIGREPAGGIFKTGDGKFCGVILNTQGQYQGAVTALSASPYSADPAGIYLVQNANSEMAGVESQDWKSQINNNVFQFFAEQNHDENQFSQQVGMLKGSSPSPSALVISSDPFFRWKAQKFSPGVTNVLNVPICYPFQDLYDADPRDASKKLLLPSGAKLSGTDTTNSVYAYYQLGAKTGEVLSAQTASQPIPPSPIASVKWDGAKWA